MKKFFFLVIATTVFCSSTATAQRLNVKSGDLSVLAGQKVISIEYDHSNFGVGKFATEKEYLDKKTEEYNAKEAGKGDTWRKAWADDRKGRYEPKFEELFNDGLASKGLSIVGGKSGAKYTLVVRTVFIEPGFNVGVMRKNAYVDFEFDIVETAGKAKVAEMTLDRVPGSMAFGMDFDTGSRIAESYAKAGKVLANYVEKKL